MEQDLIDLYMEQVSKLLEVIPERQRERALAEIRLHIDTSRSIGRSAEAIIERMGTPEELAAVYIKRHGEAPSHASRTGGTKSRRLAMGAWAAGAILVPALALVALVLAMAALVVLMYGMLNTFSPGWIVMAYAGWEVPREWSIPVAAVVGAVLGGGAWGIYAGLKAYVRWASAGYKQHVAASEGQSQQPVAERVRVQS